MEQFLEDLLDYCSEKHKEAAEAIHEMFEKALMKNEGVSTDVLERATWNYGKMDAYFDIENKILKAFKDAGKPI